MMKIKHAIYYFLFSILLLSVSCKQDDRVLFTGDEYQNIMQYLLLEEVQYSSFISIIRSGKMEQMLSSYNSNIGGQGYTLFLPNNEAVDRFIDNSLIYGSLDELLADSVYSKELVKYHTLNAEVFVEEFPNGVLPTRTLSDDFLTVIFSMDNGDINYQINNQASLSATDMEFSNGVVHNLNQMLEPVVYTAYQWIDINDDNGYSIFSELLRNTGLEDTLNYYELDELGRKIYDEYTLFAETDDLYRANEINSFTELATIISPDNNDYTSKDNALNKYARYHVLVDSYFLDEFEPQSTTATSQVYETYGDLPLSIDFGLELKVNVGSAIYDSTISENDTSYIDYILIDNNNSNKLTKTGAIHELDQLLFPFLPGRKEVTLQFYNDKAIAAASQYEGAVRIPQDELTAIELEGVDYVTYNKESADVSGISNRDYLFVNGNFTFTYHTPRILAGKYKIVMVMYSGPTASDFLCFYNDKKLGGFFRLKKETPQWLTGGRDRIVLGEVNLEGYESQEIKFNAVSPGLLMIDRIIFQPI